MYECTCCGIEYAENGERNGKEVDAHGERDADLDGFYRCIGKTFQVRNLGNVIAHQGDVGGFDRNVASHAAHRNANLGRFQCRRIVNAVTDHTNGPVFLLQSHDVFHLLLGQKLGSDLGNIDLCRKITKSFYSISRPIWANS